MSQDTETGYVPSYEDILEAQKVTFSDVMNHATGPVISVVVHVLLFTFLGSIVIFPAPDEKDELVLESTEVEIPEIDKLEEPPKPEEVMDVAAEVEMEDVDMEVAAEVDIEDMDAGDDDDGFEEDSVNLDLVETGSSLKLPGVFASRSSDASKRNSIKRYGGKKGKGRFRSKYGPASDRAILKASKAGADWFAQNQNEDGSWGEIYKPGNTSLVLLALLAQGYTPMDDEYGEGILKGIKYLCAAVDSIETVCVLDEKKSALGQPEYQSAMIGYALAEAYALTKIPMVKKAMDKQITYLVSKMLKNGAYSRKYNNEWRNILIRDDEELEKMRIAKAEKQAKKEASGKVKKKKKKDKEVGMGRKRGGGGGAGVAKAKWLADPNGPFMPKDVDLSISAWHYQALKAAYAAGCSVEGLSDSLQKSIDFVKDDRYKNSDNKSKQLTWGWSTWSNTPNAENGDRLKGFKYPMLNAGLLTLYLMGEGKSSDATKALKTLVEYDEGYYLKCDWAKIESDINAFENWWDKVDIARASWDAKHPKKTAKTTKDDKKSKVKKAKPPKVKCTYKDGEKVLEERYENGSFSLYTWYYQTQVLFQAYNGPGGTGGGAWAQWNSNFTNALIKHQQSDGSWLSPAHNSITAYGETSKVRVTPAGDTQRSIFAPTGSDSKEASKDLKVYSTAMCSLMLTVYYRYLPTYSLEKDKGASAGSATGSANDLLDDLL